MVNKLTLHNDIHEVSLLGEWIERIAETYEVPMADTFQLNLALEEAVVNVMNYAYTDNATHEFYLMAENNGDACITFTLTDDGVEFDPTAVAAPDTELSVEERPIGGLGIFLIRQIMQEVNYRRESDKNVLVMLYERKQ